MGRFSVAEQSPSALAGLDALDWRVVPASAVYTSTVLLRRDPCQSDE